MIEIKNVKVIPATIYSGSKQNRKTEQVRVAFYARVSTEKDNQIHSLQNQVDYYHKFIAKHKNWVFVGMYYDEGISATSTKKRTGFNELMKDALDGKIDLIVTKSVTRFARNTVDAISNVRVLAKNNVEVYFEKDNIWTLSGESEFILTVISAVAQEESHSISENTKWGMRKNMRNGKGCLAFSHFLGYDAGYVINEKEAEIVRRIYTEFVNGFTLRDICIRLESDKIRTVTGKEKWTVDGLRSILTNEKYKGDCLMQKYYLSDFISKKLLKNKGELTQYYVEDHHPAIIEPELWEQANKALKRFKIYSRAYVSEGFFRGLIKCRYCSLKCDAVYGVRIAHPTDKYRYVFYRCEMRLKIKCESPIIKEKLLNLMIYDILHELTKGEVKTTDIIKNVNDIVVEDKVIVKLANGNQVKVNIQDYLNDSRLAESYTYIKTPYKKCDGRGNIC